jgi:hypothetical protein
MLRAGAAGSVPRQRDPLERSCKAVWSGRVDIAIRWRLCHNGRSRFATRAEGAVQSPPGHQINRSGTRKEELLTAPDELQDTKTNADLFESMKR